MSIIIQNYDGTETEYPDFDAWCDKLDAEEKLWPWYKKAYYVWRRSDLWPSKVWYWFRCHMFTRYHILDLRTKEYKWGWCDRCDLITFANFNLLVKFIETEIPPQSCDDPEATQWDHAYKEMWALYKWWTCERNHNHGNFDMAAEAKDQEMLHRLINIRQFLWT